MPTLSVRRIATSLLDLLYPQACGGCGAYGHGLWCPSCAARIAFFTGSDRSYRLAGPPALEVVSCCAFRPPVREAIHSLKFGGTPQLAAVFAAWMTNAWTSRQLSADIVIPVPLHRTRERERGFNQSTALAAAFARSIGLPCTHDALRRDRQTQQQARLSASDRAANISGAFSVNRPLLQDKRVVIVDDVLTTGATLFECAAVCRNAGAKEVFALTIARAEET